MTQPVEQPRCQHEVITRLKDAGDYGSTVNTDWEWCCTCGSVRRVESAVWSPPANGTPNLPARLNALEAALTEARTAREEAERERDELREERSLVYETQQDYIDSVYTERLAASEARAADAERPLVDLVAAWQERENRLRDALDAEKARAAALEERNAVLEAKAGWADMVRPLLVGLSWTQGLIDRYDALSPSPETDETHAD